LPIPVDVLDLKWHAACLGVTLGPATALAASANFRDQISSNHFIDYEPRFIRAGYKRFNNGAAFKVPMTCIGAKEFIKFTNSASAVVCAERPYRRCI
jgi:hypothetical protein